ncbi:MAG: rhodanese-like domain-containing protein [Ginsengibacter sp.]
MNKRFYAIVGISIIVLTPIMIFLFKKQKKIPNTTNNKLLGFITKSLQSSRVPKINVEDVVKNNVAYIFLDAREKEEYNVSHIKNSIYVGDEKFNLASVKNIPKSAKIVVYCSVGIRSDHVTAQLRDAGYKNAYNLFGGIFEWINEGNPVFNPGGYQTPYIHAYSKFWGAFVKSGYKVYNEY